MYIILTQIHNGPLCILLTKGAAKTRRLVFTSHKKGKIILYTGRAERASFVTGGYRKPH